jgi:peptidoglycan/LPS O-acetylase OafA/YrhL
MISINSKKQHFDTFDALRFISFLIVFLSHIPIPSTSLFNFVSHSGNIGVTFFFVLSGFLITYILLHEKKNINTINLKSFLFRRILRIWPLFYLMILFAFATPIILEHLHLPSSNQGYDPNWIVSCLFLENYVMMFTNSFPNASPLRVMWSLCVEEHFYIIWGLFIYLLPLKRIPILIIGSILLASITRIIYYNFDITCYDIFSNIDYFAFGAIPAFIITIKPEFFSKISNLPRMILILILSVTVLLVFSAPQLDNIYLSLSLKYTLAIQI